MGMSIDADGLVTWTPQAADAGNIILSVIATDELGASSTQGFALSVRQTARRQFHPILS